MSVVYYGIGFVCGIVGMILLRADMATGAFIALVIAGPLTCAVVELIHISIRNRRSRRDR